MKYHDNTVKGTRRGKKWPEDVRCAAMCDLLTHNNLSDVARRYNVPESTLRSWLRQAEKKKPGERKSLFEQARENELRALARKASAAANCSVEYIRRRLESTMNDAEIYVYCKQRLDELDGLVSYNGPEDPDCTAMGPVREIEPEKPGERELLAQLMDRHRPISDFGAANFTRTLVSVTDRAAQMLGDDGAPDNTLRIEIGGTGTDDAEDMAW